MLIVYFIAPSVRVKNIVLLIGSLFFYAWGEPVYVILMLISICGNFFLVKYMSAAKSSGCSVKKHLAYAVIWNIAILFFFKYSNMVIGLINHLTGAGISELSLSLPIGISFYTFQALSYVIDVYRGDAECQSNILDFGLYISMFPQLIAGPIVKYTDIEKALHRRRVSAAAFGKGAEIFIIGLAKKVLIANNVGMLFTQISSAPADTRSLACVWLGAAAYTFQIYFDFSGYSDMAIGLGYMFGFRFPENFRYPYISGTVTEFWRRWHISLSSWFRDYVYIPLGGSRAGTVRHIRNIIIVWALTGLWHGANGNFLLWGLYYAFWLILEKYVFARFLKQHPKTGHLTTGLIFIFGWVIFAFTDIGQLGTYLGQMFGIGAAGIADGSTIYMLYTSAILLIIAALASTPLLYSLFRKIRKNARPLALVILVMVAAVSIAFLVYQSYNPFLYFRF